MPAPLTVDCVRPTQLFRYTELKWANRALTLGEFRLRPAADYKDLLSDKARGDDELIRTRQVPGPSVRISLVETGREIPAIGPITYRSYINTNYLVLCFSTGWSVDLFDDFAADSCIAITGVEEFCERLHAAAEQALPDWCGIDGRITYGRESPLRAVFSKPAALAPQNEWRFAWLPTRPSIQLKPVTLRIGNIQSISEIRGRDGLSYRSV